MGIRNLLRIAMVTPTSQIYAPSRIASEPKEITDKEFYKHWADSARGIQVSRDADGKSDPTTETAYAKGLAAWYVEATDEEIAACEAAVALASGEPAEVVTPGWQDDGSYTTESGVTYTADEMENAAWSL